MSQGPDTDASAMPLYNVNGDDTLPLTQYPASNAYAGENSTQSWPPSQQPPLAVPCTIEVEGVPQRGHFIADGEGKLDERCSIWMWICSGLSVLWGFPVGFVNICYSYMSTTETFYPMKRYYRFQAFKCSIILLFCCIVLITVIFIVMNEIQKLLDSGNPSQNPYYTGQ